MTTEILESLDLLVEAVAVVGGGRWVISTHAPVSGINQLHDHREVEVPKHISDNLGLDTSENDTENRTDRVTVTDRTSGNAAHFHVNRIDVRDGKDIFTVNGIGSGTLPHYHSHKDILVKHLQGCLTEDMDKVDAWKDEVKKTYPEHAGKIQFKYKSDANHISAEIPNVDRSFGVYDMESNAGHVLHEDQEQIIETLTKKDPIGKWISDFIDSDNPKFDGKTKEERRKMAIGAFYGAQKIEEADDVDSADYRETAGGHKARARHEHEKSENDAEKEKDKQEESFQINESNIYFDHAEAHLANANAAKAKGDMAAYHTHMIDHHDSMSQWHESKGRYSAADRENEKMKTHMSAAGISESSTKPEDKKEDDHEEVDPMIAAMKAVDHLSRSMLKDYKPTSGSSYHLTNAATRARKGLKEESDVMETLLQAVETDSINLIKESINRMLEEKRSVKYQMIKEEIAKGL